MRAVIDAGALRDALRGRKGIVRVVTWPYGIILAGRVVVCSVAREGEADLDAEALRARCERERGLITISGGRP